MSEMIDRVAEAIAKVVADRTTNDYDIAGEIAQAAARAAVEAMREPTDDMIMAGGWDQEYRPMIDAALA